MTHVMTISFELEIRQVTSTWDVFLEVLNVIFSTGCYRYEELTDQILQGLISSVLTDLIQEISDRIPILGGNLT